MFSFSYIKIHISCQASLLVTWINLMEPTYNAKNAKMCSQFELCCLAFNDLNRSLKGQHVQNRY